MNKLIEYCKRNSPPGIDLKQEYAVFIIGNCCSAVLAVFAFLINYIKHRESLFAYVSTQRILIDGAVMTPFYKLINYCFSGFFFLSKRTLSSLAVPLSKSSAINAVTANERMKKRYLLDAIASNRTKIDIGNRWKI